MINYKRATLLLAYGMASPALKMLMQSNHPELREQKNKVETNAPAN